MSAPKTKRPAGVFIPDEILDKVLEGPSADAKVLIALYRHVFKTPRAVSISKLQKETHLGYSTVAEALQRLEKIGAFTSIKEGHNSRVFVRPQNSNTSNSGESTSNSGEGVRPQNSNTSNSGDRSTGRMQDQEKRYAGEGSSTPHQTNFVEGEAGGGGVAASPPAWTDPLATLGGDLEPSSTVPSQAFQDVLQSIGAPVAPGDQARLRSLWEANPEALRNAITAAHKKGINLTKNPIAWLEKAFAFEIQNLSQGNHKKGTRNDTRTFPETEWKYVVRH